MLAIDGVLAIYLSKLYLIPPILIDLVSCNFEVFIVVKPLVVNVASVNGCLLLNQFCNKF